jgi:hypothetical protein
LLPLFGTSTKSQKSLASVWLILSTKMSGAQAL